MPKTKKYNNHRLRLIYNYLLKYKLLNQGNSPTLRDICAVIEVDSTSLVVKYLNDLIELGLITRSGTGICIVGALWVAPKKLFDFKEV